MSATHPSDNEALRRFLRRVWQSDITPLLQGARAAQRAKSARVGGKIAATTGLVLDSLFGLKGKPFTRSMTVVGSTFGALLPDVWDWRWLRENAEPGEKKVVSEQIERRAAELPLLEALAMFDLPPTASQETLKYAWREISRQWHPDKAPDEHQQAEYHVRFLAYRAAYDRLRAAYEEGLLPKAN